MARLQIRRYEITKGDAWDGANFTVTEASFNWDPSTIKVEFRDRPGGQIFVTKTPTPSYPSTGVITFSVSLASADTALFTRSQIVADVEITKPSGAKLTVLRLLFIVNPEVTI